jgi:hypothetical protein
VTRALRAVAVAIAGLALLDPACPGERVDAPLVSLLDADAADSSARAPVAAAVRAALGDRYRVVRGYLPSADAVVLTDDAVPPAWRHEPPRQPVFVLTSERAERGGALDRPGARPAPPRVRWRALTHPARVRVGERVALAAEVDAEGAGPDDSLIVTARQAGVLLARAARALPSGVASASTAPSAAGPALLLPVVPVDTGVLAVEVEAALWRAPVRAARTALLDVTATRWAVSGIDVRPSWQGTFVRRALAADARFALASRVAVSRTDAGAVSRTRGAAPPLGALPAPPALEVLVLGAADALGEGDLARVDAWVRAGGGGAVLLLDALPGPALQRWLAVTSWTRLERPEPVAGRAVGAWTPDAAPADAAPADSAGDPLRGRSWVVPARLPAGAEPWLVVSAGAGAAAGAEPPVAVWSRTIGRGTVLVVGAVDAWMFREPARSGFARTWPALLAAVIARRSVPVALEVTPAAGRGWWEARLVGDSAALSAWQPAGGVTFTLVDDRGGSQSLPALGTATGTAWRAPAGARWQRLLARGPDGVAAAESGVLPVMPSPPAPAAAADLRALARASGGAAVPATSLAALVDSLAARVAPAARRGVWHPWRSPWWLVPFAGALLTEWWWRRRRGRA